MLSFQSCLHVGQLYTEIKCYSGYIDADQALKSTGKSRRPKSYPKQQAQQSTLTLYGPV